MPEPFMCVRPQHASINCWKWWEICEIFSGIHSDAQTKQKNLDYAAHKKGLYTPS